MSAKDIRTSPAKGACNRVSTTNLQFEEDAADDKVDVTTVAAAVVTAVTLYLIGALAQRMFGFPAPVAMLVIAVLLKLARAISPSLQVGAFHVYKFFSTAVTYPLLFAIGVSLTPWDKLVAAFTVPYLITIVSTVVTIIATGFFVGGWLKMYPIDTAIVTACHSGQGGTGDVAILTAGQSHAVDAVCPDCHAHRRCDYCDDGADCSDADRLTLPDIGDVPIRGD